MSPLVEYGIVFLVVAGCAFHVARLIYRSARRLLATRRGACGGCGTCGGEPPGQAPTRPVQVERLERR